MPMWAVHGGGGGGLGQLLHCDRVRVLAHVRAVLSDLAHLALQATQTGECMHMQGVSMLSNIPPLTMLAGETLECVCIVCVGCRRHLGADREAEFGEVVEGHLDLRPNTPHIQPCIPTRLS